LKSENLSIQLWRFFLKNQWQAVGTKAQTLLSEMLLGTLRRIDINDFLTFLSSGNKILSCVFEVYKADRSKAENCLLKLPTIKLEKEKENSCNAES